MTEDDLSFDDEDMDPITLMEQGEDAEKAGEKEIAAKIYNAAGNIYMSVAEYDEALPAFEKSLGLYKELKDETGISDTMYNLGVAQINLEKWSEAVSTCDAAMKLFKKLKNSDGEADATYGLALATLGQGGFEDALELFKKAQKSYQKAENVQGVASTIMDMGSAYADKEDWVNAEKTFKKALTTYQELDDKAGIADALSLLGDIAEMKNNQKKAAELFVEAAQNYLEAEIFDISREVLDRAEQKMWDIPKATRRRLRRVIDDVRDALPEEVETDDDEVDEDLLEFTDLE
ncbi:MAG: tetratricopeptide repeat protein [Candidatus Thorarchaeota archaeon]